MIQLVSNVIKVVVIYVEKVSSEIKQLPLNNVHRPAHLAPIQINSIELVFHVIATVLRVMIEVNSPVSLVLQRRPYLILDASLFVQQDIIKTYNNVKNATNNVLPALIMQHATLVKQVIS